MKSYTLDNQFICNVEICPDNFTGITKFDPSTDTRDVGKYVVTRLYLNGLLHRIGAPAIEYSDGCMEWWVEGKLHRLDGPAYIHPSDRTEEYWINDKKIETKEQFLLLTSIMKLKGLL